MPPSLSSSSSSGHTMGEAPVLGGVRRNAGNGGSISATGTANNPVVLKTSVPSFAAVVSASSAGGGTKSPLSASSTTPNTVDSRQKHYSQPLSSSSGSSPLSDNSSDGKNSLINRTSFTIGNGIATNGSIQSTVGSSSSAASSTSCMRNISEGDTTQDSGSDDIDNDREDSESSDVEIYLNSLDLRDSTVRMHGGPNSSYSPDSTYTKSNSMAITSHFCPPHPHSPLHLQSHTTETGHTAFCITANQTRDKVQPPTEQENCGPADTTSIFGANGCCNGQNALSYGLGVSPSATSIIDESANKKSHSPLSLGSTCQEQPQQQRFSLHQQSNPMLMTSGSSRGHTPLPTLKIPMQPATIPSLVDGSDDKPPTSAHFLTSSRSSTIDLANLSIKAGGSATLTRGSALQTANAGVVRERQMGMMSISGSHPLICVSSAGEDAAVSPTFVNSNLSSSFSEPSLGSCLSDARGSGSDLKVNEDGINGANVTEKTPNVYINGLPPHFPEDELFNLCCQFGTIWSVRTFTRHVNDSESGYGFVLFESIEQAEKCINNLRQYRNLHPTFAKQIHKIPGIPHAADPSSSTWNGSNNGDSTCTAASFKAKMERLHDPTSTNLYMEGLPLSIDEPTLSALVSPHRIVSSRFFQTRLSNPPRIIAFVRLETRVGAEEVIERLHGRMVRGWNDTGSRISVRFADTNEQRELRRTERAAQEGDVSPSRLTIAQASLLNLRGQELRPTAKPAQQSHLRGTVSLPPPSSSRGFATSVSAPDFSSDTTYGQPGQSNFPITGSTGRITPGRSLTGGGSGLEVDYSLAPGVNLAVGVHSRSKSPYGQEYLHPQIEHSQRFAGHNGMDPAIQLGPMTTGGLQYRTDRGYGDSLNGAEDNPYALGRLSQTRVASYGQQQRSLQASQSVDSMIAQPYIRPSPVYTRSGYTPTEEYIMRTHAESAALAQAQQYPQGGHLPYQSQHSTERGRPPLLDSSRRTAADVGDATNIGVGMRAYRAQASLMSPTVMSSSASLNSIPSFGSSGGLTMGNGGFGLAPNGSGVTEDEFHTGGSSASLTALRNLHASRFSREFASYQIPMSMSPFLPPSSSTTSLNQDISTSSPSTPPETSAGSTTSPNPNDTIVSAYHQLSSTTHMRSSTLPQHRSSAVANGHVKGHHQHNSMSMPKQNLSTPQHASVARLSASSSLLEGSSGTIYESEGQGIGENHQQGKATNSLVTSSAPSPSSNANQPPNAGATASMKMHYSIFGDSDQSPPLSTSSSLISPTLTYASQTPSTLSPSTPFFGSFNSNAEGFDKNGAGEQTTLIQNEYKKPQCSGNSGSH